MQLSFVKPYRSIADLEATNLPSLTVLTGLNGSGKSHLLEAIQNGSVRVNQGQTAIAFYNWTTFIIPELQASNSHRVQEIVTQVADAIERSKPQQAELFKFAVEFGLPENYRQDIVSLTSIETETLEKYVNERQKIDGRLDRFYNEINSVGNQLISNFNPGTPHRNLIQRASDELKIPIAALQASDVRRANSSFLEELNAFSNSFAQIFVEYRDRRLENKLEQNENSDRALTDEEFLQKYGSPPWQVMNNALEVGGLSFRISEPRPTRYDPYTPVLIRSRDQKEIEFQHLSSGEKILTALSVALYYSTDGKKSNVKFPNVLLLDEIDAPLHPEMARSFIRIIEDVFVRKHKVECILTTHSASTVALAPENSVYIKVMGEHKLSKVTKAAALQHLTFGVPTLSISYDGRRQVFVESPMDARNYEAIYQILKPYFGSERSLNFIATGIKKKDGKTDIGTGCEIVKAVVKKLNEAGNNSVFGLIDWDGKNDPGGNLMVLAHNVRDGVENLVMDPLLILVLIAEEDRDRKSDIGLLVQESYAQFANLPSERLQKLIDNVQEKVLGEAIHEKPKLAIKYFGNFELMITEDYLKMDDHELEKLIVTVFPILNEVSKRQEGKLTYHIVKHVMQDFPTFVPIEVYDVFQNILKA